MSDLVIINFIFEENITVSSFSIKTSGCVYFAILIKAAIGSP